MITWLMVGLLLFTESACDRAGSKNAVSGKPGKNESAAGKPDDEDIYRLTCYTCVNVSNNKMCNEWAIDTPCPAGRRDFCRSLHLLDSLGHSVLVNKSCANKIECSPASVGCVPMDNQKVCISCCDTSYCNVESPTNATSATYTRKRPSKPKRKKKKTAQTTTKSQDNDDKDAKEEEEEDEEESSAAGSSLSFAAAAFAISVFLNRAYH